MPRKYNAEMKLLKKDAGWQRKWRATVKERSELILSGKCQECEFLIQSIGNERDNKKGLYNHNDVSNFTEAHTYLTGHRTKITQVFSKSITKGYVVKLPNGEVKI